MTLIVEDGTGLATAESYVSVSDADAWLASRGYTAWAALSEAVKEQNLRLATDFMTQRYREGWAGYRRTATQALDWPRVWVKKTDAPVGYGSWAAYYDENVVPAEVTTACVQLAYKASQGTTLNPDVGPQVASEQVGPISTSYFAGSRQADYFRAVDELLNPLMRNQSGITVARA